MAKHKERVESLAMLLVKKEITHLDSIFKDRALTKIFSLEDKEGFLGTLYIQTRHPKPPRWANFFSDQIEAEKFGFVSSSSAVLYIKIADRGVLVTFGQGRYLLNQTCWEEKFGIRTALNAIGPENLRSIDKYTLDTYGRHSRVQNSRESGPNEFGIDFERDLIRAVTGKPSSEDIAERLSGFDSLRFSKRTTLDTLRVDIEKILDVFELETYKEKFPWIDYISEIKDVYLKEVLDSLLVEVITGDRLDRFWLAVPEPIDWGAVNGFKYPGRGSRPIHHDLDFDDFLMDHHLTTAEVSIDFLKSHSVSAVSDDGVPLVNWNIYKCMYCEISYSNHTYILTYGKWYEIEPSFVSDVTRELSHMAWIDLKLPDYDDIDENSYNKRVAQNSSGQIYCMDIDMIQHGGGNSSIEFCDLITQDLDLIHVKRYSGSSVLSHLFNQGLASAELFAFDHQFREKLTQKLPIFCQLRDPNERPQVQRYRVVYALINSSDSDMSVETLPFFSRLSLRQAFRRLQGFGYKVAMTNIRVAKARKVTRRYPPPGRRS